MAWNRPTEGNGKIAPGKAAGKPLSPAFAIIAIVIVAAIVAACYFLFFASTRNPAEEAVKTEVEKSTEEIAFEAAKAPDEKPLDPNDLHDPRQPWFTTPGVPMPYKGPDGKLYGVMPDGSYRSPDSSYAEKKRLLDAKEARENPFKHPSQTMLYALVSSWPGAVILPMKFDDAFMADLQQALIDPIEISKDDDPEAARRKQVMIGVMEDIRAALKDGEDIKALVEATYAERQRQNRLYETIQEGLLELRANDASPDEIDDYLDASEKMFENNNMQGTHLLITRKDYLRRLRNGRGTPKMSEP